MPVKAICPHEFLQRVEPLLVERDVPGLVSLLKSRWTSEQIVSVLASDHQNARKMAALALGLIGSSSCIDDLALQLRCPDPVTNQMAEHALWSIWFRSGTPAANDGVCRGAKALGRRDLDAALAHFSQAISDDPTFAEAYNQRAIAHYLNEDYQASLEDCVRAVERMPQHFGAWAGMGHCYVHLDRVDDAIRCYEKALWINPHLLEIAEALPSMKKVGTCN